MGLILTSNSFAQELRSERSMQVQGILGNSLNIQSQRSCEGAQFGLSIRLEPMEQTPIRNFVRGTASAVRQFNCDRPRLFRVR